MNESSDFRPQTVVLYSVGLLGGSLGLALKSSGYTGKIIGLSSPASIETALSIGCIDEGYGYDQLDSVIEKADCIFLCSPISVILDTIERLCALKLPDGLVITDVGSTKGQIAEKAWACLPNHVRFIGGHPMAGSEKSGPAAADPYLFQNAIYVLTAPQKKPEPWHKTFGAFLTRHLGCRTIHLDPQTHDEIAAMVSHAPHILAVALVNAAQEAETRIPGTLQLAAGGFKDLTRIASSPYRMWRDILLTNKTAIEPILSRCIDLLREMKELLASDGLGPAFESAAKTRGKMPSRNKGFLAPLHEALILAKDRPGVIAELAQALDAHKINIKDIEVLKIREGEGGTIRLGFDSQETALQAIDILRKNGFSARERT